VIDDRLRNEIIETLRRGEPLAPEWERELFPPERREYELVYAGKARAEEVLSDTMAVPLQPVRAFGGNGTDWRNMLIFGDNAQVMRSLLEMKREGRLVSADGTPGIKLVYIDPPFATKQDFDGSRDEKAYQDKLSGARFLEFIRRRLILIRELLAPDGVLFVHIDWKKGHYIKALLDELFGESRFRNEIVWWYYNKMQGNVNRFPSNHETLFFYSASDSYTFHPQYEERQEGTIRQLKRVWDSKTARLVNAKGPDGKVLYIETDERRIDDVWRLSMLQPADKTENNGYPTQKPESLLALVLSAASNRGDLVMDCFAGSGTTLAVAEKLGRRWIGIDCGKLSIYTIQKRLLNLRSDIGNDGTPLAPRPFALYNAGLYDFSSLKKLPWSDWRFFALKLFGCKDEPHTIGGLKLDGKLKGASVLVFNHHEHPGKQLDEETVADIHRAVGRKTGHKFFIIAPRGVFAFQQDYIDLDAVRYYALRIPYSIINELHSRQFTALAQPNDERAVNETVDAVGFDFIRTPKVAWSVGSHTPKGEMFPTSFLKVNKFESTARVRGAEVNGGLDTLSMILFDLSYDNDVFNVDLTFFAQQLAETGWQALLPSHEIGTEVMVVFVDVYGNEAREVIPRKAFGLPTSSTSKAKPAASKKKANARGSKPPVKMGRKDLKPKQHAKKR
jgi:site-specific DNA-methyltransferase (adenine-specific)/adenine-specific DNA-methyltransferase